MPKRNFCLFPPHFLLRHFLDLDRLSRCSLPDAHHLCRPLEPGFPALAPDLELAAASVLECLEHIDDVASGHSGPGRPNVPLDTPDGCRGPVPLAAGKVI